MVRVGGLLTISPHGRTIANKESVPLRMSRLRRVASVARGRARATSRKELRDFWCKGSAEGLVGYASIPGVSMKLGSEIGEASLSCSLKDMNTKSTNAIAARAPKAGFK